MDRPFSGFVLDPSKCRDLSLEDKREIIRELSKWPESAPEKLQTWTRRELIEILCAEKGEERKYSSLTKQKLIDYLLKVVSKKKSGEPIEEIDTKKKNDLHPRPLLPSPQTPSKRQRKNDHPSRLPFASSNLPGNSEDHKSIRYCPNIACVATVSQEAAFCKRCSCYICHKYDENKDPTLWLVCKSEAPSERDPCGLSCHVQCAIKHERAGISKNGQCTRLDGSYYCIYCGKVNDLLRCWRKQLVIAKDARRVDMLSHRLSLSHNLLSLTEKYQGLHEIVDTAMKKLESEVGPLNDLPKITRGIVNRLSVGAEVQRLCARAVEALDSMLSSALPADALIHEVNSKTSNFIKFEDLSPTSVSVVLGSEDYPSLPPDLVGFTLWHRKADVADYPTEPFHTLCKGKNRVIIEGLTPATEYMIKVIAFNNTSELAKWEVGLKTDTILDVKSSLGDGTFAKLHCGSSKTNSSCLSNPSSEGEESNNTNSYGDLNRLADGVCYQEKPKTIVPEKSSQHTFKDTSALQNALIDTTIILQATGQDETPGYSGSALDEEPNLTIQTEFHIDSTNSTEHNQVSDVPKLDNESNTPAGNKMLIVPNEASESRKPVSPRQLETGKESSGWTVKAKPGSNLLENGSGNPEREPGSSSKERSETICEKYCTKDGPQEDNYEYCVKVVRRLECEGYIETHFRVKFLTWFSLRATPQERKVVDVYVQTLVDDPVSLAGQLVDTFSEAICRPRPPPVPTGFCSRLWH